MLAEDRLQVRKSVIAHGLREADQRRGLHLRLRRDGSRGAEGDLVRISDREGGNLRQALRQSVAPRHDARPQAHIIARRLALGCHVLPWPNGPIGLTKAARAGIKIPTENKNSLRVPFIAPSEGGRNGTVSRDRPGRSAARREKYFQVFRRDHRA
jgi:hypothetical protein